MECDVCAKTDRARLVVIVGLRKEARVYKACTMVQQLDCVLRLSFIDLQLFSSIETISEWSKTTLSRMYQFNDSFGGSVPGVSTNEEIKT